MTQITTEKERKLKFVMNMMGLNLFSFWFSWLFTHFIFNFLSTMVLVVSGIIFQFDFFVNTHIFINIIFFFSFSMSVVPLGYLLTNFIEKSVTSTVVGFILFVLGLVLQMLFTDFPVYIWFDNKTSEVWQYLFMFYPPFNFAKVFADISQLSSTDLFEVKYYNWSNLFNTIKIDHLEVVSPPAIYSILYLWMDFIVFMAFTLLLDSNLYLQFFKLFKCKSKLKSMEFVPLIGNEDVTKEIKRTLDGKNDESAVRILGLTKIFKKFPYIFPKKNQTAVDDIFFSIDKGECLGLLGKNGAGKTTLLGMLTGILEPSSG
jgi:hypothetical protein